MDIQEGLEGLEMSMTIRLTCKISPQANVDLSRIIARLESRKGKAIIKLMELARDDADHPRRPYDDEGKDVTCTLNAVEDWLASFKSYRTKHGLWENTAFFKDSLLRGISIYLDNNGNGDD